ncbi:unnamed protein product, partial [Mycena citricolor]
PSTGWYSNKSIPQAPVYTIRHYLMRFRKDSAVPRVTAFHTCLSFAWERTGEPVRPKKGVNSEVLSLVPEKVLCGGFPVRFDTTGCASVEHMSAGYGGEQASC